MKILLVIGIGALGLVACEKKPEINSPTTATGKVGQSFEYQITATESPTAFSASVPPPGGLHVDASTGKITGTPEESGAFQVALTATNAAGQGTKTLSLTVENPTLPPPPPPPAPVTINKDRELFIIDPKVVTDPVRTGPGGAWSFKAALSRIAGPGVDIEAYAQAWISTWEENQGIPGVNDAFATRPATAAALREAWANNRFRLLAIVNRVDLSHFQDNDRNKPVVKLGEGRFVYEVLDAAGQPLRFTIIFEYELPHHPALGDLTANLRDWAKRWNALGDAALDGSEGPFSSEYRAKLQLLTDEYSAHGRLSQIRTNEFIAAHWELREFHHRDGPAALVRSTLALNPSSAFLTTPPSTAPRPMADLAAFINQNEADIINGNINFTPGLIGIVAPVPFPPKDFTWVTGAASARANFIMSFNTCNGCHGGDAGEEGTFFQHVFGSPPTLSAFLTKEITLKQALPGKTTTQHNEMDERITFMRKFASPPAMLMSAAAESKLDGIVRGRANRSH